MLFRSILLLLSVCLGGFTLNAASLTVNVDNLQQVFASLLLHTPI